MKIVIKISLALLQLCYVLSVISLFNIKFTTRKQTIKSYHSQDAIVHMQKCDYIIRHFTQQIIFTIHRFEHDILRQYLQHLILEQQTPQQSQLLVVASQALVFSLWSMWWRASFLSFFLMQLTQDLEWRTLHQMHESLLILW